MQDVLPARVIVVDDGSDPPIAFPDNAFGDLNVIVVRHPHNRGPAAARNTGLRLADMEWISFLDSDDRWLPGSLETRWRFVVERHKSAPPLTIFGCGWIDEDENGLLLSQRMPKPASNTVAFASGCWFAPGSCVIMNRRAILDTGVYQDERLRRLEDLDWFLALSLRGAELRTMPLVGVAIERTRDLSPDVVEHSAGLILEKWRHMTEDQQVLSRLSAYLDLEMGVVHYFCGNLAGAGFYLARSLITKPRTKLQLSPGWDTPPRSSLEAKI